MYDWMVWPGGEWRTQRMIEKDGSGAVYEIQRGMEKALMKVICIPAEPSETELRQQEGMNLEYIEGVYAEQVRKAEKRLERIRSLQGHEHLMPYDEYKILKEPEGIGWKILLRAPFQTSAKTYFEEHFFDEKRFLRFCEDVFDAVQVCHAAGILHGNIAPENVFMNENGDFLLGNFEIDPCRESSRSIECRPPEADGGAAYSASEELYAVGLLFYKVLNRMRGPFMPMYGLPMPGDAEKAAEALRSGKKIPDPAYGSREIREAVLKAIAFNPEDRFAEIGEFREALGIKEPDQSGWSGSFAEETEEGENKPDEQTLSKEAPEDEEEPVEIRELYSDVGAFRKGREMRIIRQKAEGPKGLPFGLSKIDIVFGVILLHFIIMEIFAKS